MVHDQRNSPPARDDDTSPHQEDMRSRHDLDDDRHRRSHYDHHDDRRERSDGDGHHRSTSNDREPSDRRDDHHHREDLDNRRYRHDDHHNQYPDENHHHSDRNGSDRRDSQDRHEEPRHHAQDDRSAGDNRGDDRDRSEDRHARGASNGNSGPSDDRDNSHDHSHSHRQSPPDRSDGPDAPSNANGSSAPPPRHDMRSPPHHSQPHEPSAMDTGVAPSSDQANPPADDSLVNLFVRNVAKHVQENQLIDLFSKYGSVDSAVVVRDPHSRECRGFGFVKMKNEKDAQAAIDTLREFEFEGRQISVERAKRNGPHSRTPGAYMGLDRRIRDRYAGIKRSREYAYAYVGGPYAPPPPSHYPPYRPPPRYHDGPRPRHDYRSMHPPPPPPEYHRGPPPPPMNPRGGYDQRGPSDERERQRRRYDPDGGAPRYSPRGGDPPPRDQRVDGRDPPVPRESAEDMI